MLISFKAEMCEKMYSKDMLKEYIEDRIDSLSEEDFTKLVEAQDMLGANYFNSSTAKYTRKTLSEGTYFLIEKDIKLRNKYGVDTLSGLKTIKEGTKIEVCEDVSVYHASGKLLIAPFDWSIDERGNFDYSFEFFVGVGWWGKNMEGTLYWNRGSETKNSNN